MNKNKCQTVYLASGSVEGFVWELSLSVYAGTKGLHGNFICSSEYRREQSRIRYKDRKYFLKYLGTDYMKDKEVHHMWDNGAVCYLFSHKEHVRRDRHG